MRTKSQFTNQTTDPNSTTFQLLRPTPINHSLNTWVQRVFSIQAALLPRISPQTFTRVSMTLVRQSQLSLGVPPYRICQRLTTLRMWTKRTRTPLLQGTLVSLSSLRNIRSKTLGSNRILLTDWLRRRRLSRLVLNWTQSMLQSLNSSNSNLTHKRVLQVFKVCIQIAPYLNQHNLPEAREPLFDSQDIIPLLNILSSLINSFFHSI